MEGDASHHHVPVRPFTASGFDALLWTMTNDILSFSLCNLSGIRQAAHFVCLIALQLQRSSFAQTPPWY